jgi:hypothetical protein
MARGFFKIVLTAILDAGSFFRAGPGGGFGIYDFNQLARAPSAVFDLGPKADG